MPAEGPDSPTDQEHDHGSPGAGFQGFSYFSGQIFVVMPMQPNVYEYPLNVDVDDKPYPKVNGVRFFIHHQ